MKEIRRLLAAAVVIVLTAVPAYGQQGQRQNQSEWPEMAATGFPKGVELSPADKAREVAWLIAHPPKVHEVRGGERREAHQCYPAGHAANPITPQWPNGDCAEPGAEMAGSWLAHWGNEPYYNTGRRYVWVVEQSGPGPIRDLVKAFVDHYNQKDAAIAGNQPYFLYYTGEQLGWSGCGGQPAQHIEVCNRDIAHAGTTWYITGGSVGGRIIPADHLNHADVTIDVGLGGVWRQNTVNHEMGHTVGYDHDQDCLSVMTYCDSYRFSQALWMRGAQDSVYFTLYQQHQGAGG